MCKHGCRSTGKLKILASGSGSTICAMAAATFKGMGVDMFEIP